MKGFKTLVTLSSFALCLGAASLASAATIGAPGQTFNTPGGSITVKSPSSYGAAVTCSIDFHGVVNANGTATIDGATVSGSNPLCGLPKMKGFPNPGWTLALNTNPDNTVTKGTVTNVGYTIAFIPATNCGPTTIDVTWDGTSLHATNQALSGSCTVVSLDATPSPAVTVTP